MSGRDTQVPDGRTDQGGDIFVVGGPRPYLWIGGPNGRCLATVDADLRAVRDAITAALRHAAKQDA